MIFKDYYSKFFIPVNPKDTMDLPVHIKKTSAIGWTTSLPLPKLEVPPPISLKEAIRNLLC